MFVSPFKKFTQYAWRFNLGKIKEAGYVSITFYLNKCFRSNFLGQVASITMDYRLTLTENLKQAKGVFFNFFNIIASIFSKSMYYIYFSMFSKI